MTWGQLVRGVGLGKAGILRRIGCGAGSGLGAGILDAEAGRWRQQKTPPKGAGLWVVRDALIQIRRPIAVATSAIRHEKPHSLSYHASTRTWRPTTLVWSGAKIDECVVWLKSIETLGSGS